MHDFDVQNINMTINYCRQTLRIIPSRILLIGNACSKYETTMDMIAPAICISYPHNIIASREDIAEFIIPISVILNIKDIEDGNLLPQGYRSFIKHKSVLTYYTAFFVLFSIIGSGYIKTKTSEIMSVKSKTNSLRTEIMQMQPTYQNYEVREKEFQRFMPLINFMNNINSSPDSQKALITLSSLKEPYMKNVNVSSIEVKPEGDAVRLHLKGNITEKHFIDMQQTYQNFINGIKNTRGIEVLTSRIDLKDMAFQIEVKYR
jgi:prefoldin subunit 5